MQKMKKFVQVALLILLPLLAWAERDFTDTYEIGPGDRIQIIVYEEEDLSFRNILINTSGVIDYPYLGKIDAKGKTAQELQRFIKKGLKGNYLVKPKVMVNFVAFREVYINGEVRSPGGYPYQPGLTVDKAVALAGGFTDRASRRKITLTSNVQSNRSNGKSKSVKLHHKVSPGDIIVVDESLF